MSNRTFNFNAGPAILPVPVLEQAQAELLDFAGCGMSVMEISHRSSDFERILAKAENGLRHHMGISDDYAVLFLQGGASLQFAMAPLNLYLNDHPIDVIHTGFWTQKAIAELEKVAEYRLAGSTEAEQFRRLPRSNELALNPEASYLYLASNNTIFGTQWSEFPATGGAPIVADMSSDILSRVVDVSRFGLIFAGAQKNIGPSGVTVVIIRRDLAERASKTLPVMLQYRTHINSGSLYNTPPTFAIYITSLVMDWITAEGGIPALERRNEEKAKMLYDAIDNSYGFYCCPVEKQDRSRMNVVFRIQDGNEKLEKQFIEEAKAAGFVGLKGHRSVGGLRASIYNAQPLVGVQSLVDFMKIFASKHP